ncbi:Uncharacterised protein [Yersinia enterocolitica]|nr:Uncharacterised protein [Yersinia enterocolitica]
MNIQRTNTFGHHGLGFDVAAVGADFHGIALLNALFRRQFFANFHKLFWLSDSIEQRMLSPVVEMFCQTISGADIRELLMRTHCSQVIFKDARCWVGYHIRMQWVSAQWRFEWLIVFREWPFCHFVDGKQTPHAFRLHNERPDITTRRGSAVIWNIDAAPFGTIPLQ